MQPGSPLNVQHPGVNQFLKCCHTVWIDMSGLYYKYTCRPLFIVIQNENQKIPHCKSDIKIVERATIDAPDTQMHDRSLSWLDTGTSIKVTGQTGFLSPSLPSKRNISFLKFKSVCWNIIGHTSSSSRIKVRCSIHLIAEKLLTW